MSINLKQYVWVAALAAGIAVSGGALRADDPDYSKNKTYQQGVREGHADQVANKDHSKKRHFKKDDDQKAYEAGYQQGHQGQGH
jgi:hypothetical protein